MKTLNNYIIEKFKINSHNSKGASKYNPDDLNGDDTLIYSDMNNEDDEGDSYNDFIDTMESINSNYTHFIVCKFNSLSKIEGKTNIYEKTINDYSDDLNNIKGRIITGHDLGYEVRISHGHIEIDCVNSGSRATYYIYSLNDKSYEDIESWFDGDLENDKLDFLYQQGNIIPIEL